MTRDADPQARLQELLDKQDITEVLYRYSRGMDRQDRRAGAHLLPRRRHRHARRVRGHGREVPRLGVRVRRRPEAASAHDHQHHHRARRRHRARRVVLRVLRQLPRTRRHAGGGRRPLRRPLRVPRRAVGHRGLRVCTAEWRADATQTHRWPVVDSSRLAEDIVATRDHDDVSYLRPLDLHFKPPPVTTEPSRRPRPQPPGWRRRGPNTPARRRPSVRRTTTHDCTRPHGLDGPVTVVATGRDLLTRADGSTVVLDAARLDVQAKYLEGTFLALAADPPARGLAGLVGTSFHRGFRPGIETAIPGESASHSVRFQLLDELPAAVFAERPRGVRRRGHGDHPRRRPREAQPPADRPVRRLARRWRRRARLHREGSAAQHRFGGPRRGGRRRSARLARARAAPSARHLPSSSSRPLGGRRHGAGGVLFTATTT